MNKINAAFLAAIDTGQKQRFLAAIARQYGIGNQQAYDEVTGVDAEHLLDYMVEPERSEASVLMQALGLRQSHDGLRDAM